MSEVFTLQCGTTPLLVSLPHIGTSIPEDLRGRYVHRALDVEDTDWHLTQLYDFVPSLGASLIVPHFSRYVIDLNRPAESTPMYPGANNTELCPLHFFTGDDLYLPDSAPDEAEIAWRLEVYWHPYHRALSGELERLRNEHGYALLFDGHSIKSHLPWLFDGKLPDVNLGTGSGKSCATALRSALAKLLEGQQGFTHAIDGRFKGGYITRFYGHPAGNVHAVQLEICWSCYMEESPPFRYDPSRAAKLQPLLRRVMETMLDFGS